MTLFAAWKLGPAAFGTFALSMAIVQMCWLGVDLGTGAYGLRQVARDPENHVETLAELVLLNTALAVAVAAGVVAVALSAINTPSLRQSVLAMTPYLLTFAAFPDWYLRGRGKLRSLALANGATAAVLVVGSLLASVPNIPAAYGLAWAVSPAGGALMFWSESRRIPKAYRWHVSVRQLYRHLRTSILFATAGVLTGAGPTIVIIGMAATASAPVLGAFALGLRLAQNAITAYWLFLQNLVPRLIRLDDGTKPKESVALSVAAGIAMFLVGTSVLYFGVNQLGSQYRNWLIWTVAGLAVITPWAAKASAEILLVSRDRDRARIWVALASLAGCVVAALAGSAFGEPALIPAIVICGEIAAASLGLWLLTTSGRNPRTSIPLAGKNV